MRQNPEMIEDQIERTRERIDARLNSLNSELNPTNLMSNALGTNSQNPAEMLDVAITKARENPLGAALLSVGLASLLTGKPNLPKAPTMPDMEEVKAQARVKKYRAETKLADVKSSVSETGESLVHNVKRAPSLAKGKAEGAVDWLVENPLASGLMAVAAGAALSSIFATKSTTSRLSASRELHKEAREEDIALTAAPKPVRRKAPAKKTARSTTKKATTKRKTPASAVTTPSAVKRSTAVLGEQSKTAGV